MNKHVTIKYSSIFCKILLQKNISVCYKNILQLQQFAESFFELFCNMMSQQKNLHCVVSVCWFCLNFVNWEILKQIDKKVLDNPFKIKCHKPFNAQDWAKPIIINWQLVWGFQLDKFGSLSNDDVDGSENHAKKNEFASFQTLSRLFGPTQFVKCGQFLLDLNSSRALSNFEKRKENSSSYVHVLHKTSH